MIVLSHGAVTHESLDFLDSLVILSIFIIILRRLGHSFGRVYHLWTFVFLLDVRNLLLGFLLHLEKINLLNISVS